jgi:tetratricopeptide (TPR) repeat protein
MANGYGNLGILYKTLGDLDRAEEMYQKSLLLFRELESPLAEEVADLINGLRSV